MRKGEIINWPEVELNHRHEDFQSTALPPELSSLIEKCVYCKADLKQCQVFFLIK